MLHYLHLHIYVRCCKNLRTATVFERQHNFAALQFQNEAIVNNASVQTLANQSIYHLLYNNTYMIILLQIRFNLI